MSAGSGLLLSLAFPPAEIWPVALVALAPWLWIVRRGGAGRGALLGFVFGVAFFGATLYWIFVFGALAWSALTAMSAASTALVGALAPVIVRPGRPLVSAVAVASLWTVVDWVRGVFPLGGFTWGSLGISQVDDRVLLPLAAVTGVWGVTFVVVAVNALIVDAAAGGGGALRRAVPAAAAAALVLAPVAIPFSTPNGSAVDVAVVQVDVRTAPGTTATEEDTIVAQRNVTVHRTLSSGDRPDLVLWGEGALDPGASGDPATVQAVREAVAAVGAPTALGAVMNDPDGRQRTSELVLDGTGAVVDRYDKVHLVPFGEYVPWRHELDWISATKQIPVDRTPGTIVHTVEAPGVPPFGTPICYENSFPALPRAFVRDGATFLVVPVNNASYGFTAASDQHLQMSRMRAVETGRWVVDAAVSGVSAFIGADGRVVASTGLFESTVLRRTITTSTATTPYVRWGDWFVVVLVVVLIVLFLLPRRRTAVRPRPGPLPAAPRILVVLPTYDERETIRPVIEGVLAHPEGPDVLVVDDSSPDGTADVVRSMIEGDGRVKLHERPAKSGLATAYLEGFRYAVGEGYDLVVEMDSDLSHDPAELSQLLGAATRHDLTVGSRYIPGGSVTNWSRGRVALSWLGNLYARFMLGIRVHDATSGYRVYRREVLERLLQTPFATDGYGFQIELVMRADRLGYDVGEAPITFREREHGVSKISRAIVAEALWSVTRWGFALRLGRAPTF